MILVCRKLEKDLDKLTTQVSIGRRHQIPGQFAGAFVVHAMPVQKPECCPSTEAHLHIGVI